MAPMIVEQKRPQLPGIEIAQGQDRSRSGRGERYGASAGKRNLLGLCGSTDPVHQRVGFRYQLVSHVIDLLENCLHGNFGGHHAGHEVLQSCPEQPARHYCNEQDHEYSGQHATKLKTSVKKNHWQAEQAQPQMPAQPGLGATQTPDGHFLSPGQQAREDHEGEPDDSESQAGSGPATGPSGRTRRVSDIHERGHAQNNQRSDQPFPVCGINSQVRSNSGILPGNN